MNTRVKEAEERKRVVITAHRLLHVLIVIWLE